MYLGIDLGTSSLKAQLIDDEQRSVESATHALEVSRPRPGWSEQNPAHWIEAAEAVLDALKASHPGALAATKAIGLSGQMHGATLLDEIDRVLRPCILWNDVRSSREAAELDLLPEFRALTGNIVFPGFTAPKLVWTRRNEPKIHACTARVLLPKDYLRLWLTGEHVSDMSDAAGTGWLDTGSRAWSEALLDHCEMNAAQMPRLVEGTDTSGTLRREIAARWGFGPSVKVAGGGGDNAASGVGVGAVAPGSGFVSIGTSGVIFAACDGFRPAPESAVHTFCHALPRTWHHMGVILSASDALDWYARLVARSPAELTAELGDELREPGEALFLPYLCGERTPHNDAAIRGAFAGLNHASDRKAMTHAVLAGVTFALRDSLEALRDAGTRLDAVVAVGGGARSLYWLKLIATALGIPVLVCQEGDHGAAFGAARLGFVAETGADPLSICKPVPVALTIDPEEALIEAYGEAWRRFRALYPALKGAI